MNETFSSSSFFNPFFHLFSPFFILASFFLSLIHSLHSGVSFPLTLTSSFLLLPPFTVFLRCVSTLWHINFIIKCLRKGFEPRTSIMNTRVELPQTFQYYKTQRKYWHSILKYTISTNTSDQDLHNQPSHCTCLNLTYPWAISSLF
jgi:hypothetical protein